MYAQKISPQQRIVQAQLSKIPGLSYLSYINGTMNEGNTKSPLIMPIQAAMSCKEYQEKLHSEQLFNASATEYVSIALVITKRKPAKISQKNGIKNRFL